MAHLETQSPEPRILSALARQHKPVGYLLLAAALALAGVCFWLGVAFDEETRFGYRINWEFWPEAMAALLLGFVAAGAGAWLVLANPAKMTPANMRIVVLAVGGLTGLVIFLATLGRAGRWWGPIFASGIEGWQGPEWWKLWVCIAAGLFGLAVMFASLLLARSEERSNVFMRRLLYGYNAALTGLLLLTILIVGNIIVHFLWPFNVTWAGTRGPAELSERSKNILRNLKEKVYVYVIMPQQHRIFDEVRNLLDNCEAVTDKLEVRTVSPDLDPNQILQLANRLPALKVGKVGPGGRSTQQIERGIALVKGAPGSRGETLITFIPEQRLYKADFNSQAGPGSRAPTLAFQGEDVLLSELSLWEEGGKTPTVYFTQDNDEIPLHQNGRPSMLKTHLERDKFKVLGLRLRRPPPNYKSEGQMVVAPDVPKDADVVLIADLLRRFSPEALAALRRYMAKDGRLLVLLDVIHQGNRVGIPETGLAPLLADYDVEVQKAYVLRNNRTDQLTVVAVPPEESTNRVARALGGKGVYLFGVRPVRRLSASRKYQVDVLLEIPTYVQVWVEKDVETLVNSFLQFAFNLQNRKPTSREPVPVAVAVTDPKEDQPRLVVVGNARFAEFLQSSNPLAYDFVRNSLQWLRGRVADLGISPVRSDRYSFDAANTNLGRLQWLPLGLLTSLLVGLATGIWIVRRR